MTCQLTLKVKRALNRVREFVDLISDHNEMVPEPQDYRVAAGIRATLHADGKPIGGIDPIIAACAIGRDMPLITGNVRHYGYIQTSGFALQIANWRKRDGTDPSPPTKPNRNP